jgi:hypothetical protein
MDVIEVTIEIVILIKRFGRVILVDSIQLFHACSGNCQNYCPEVLEMTWELLPEITVSLFYMHITTNPLKMIMSAYHNIKKLGHNIVLKEIQRTAQRTEWSLVHLTGMTHCASFSGMEQFGSRSRGTVNCFTPPAIFKIFL